MDPTLRALRDENEIRRLVIAFSLAMDSRDVAGFRASFADEVDLDLPPLAGDLIPMSGRRRADDYARDVVALLSGFTATQHVSANHLISVTGDDATCSCYTLAQHYLRGADGGSFLTAGARYDLTARRFEDVGWRFTAFRLTHLWSQGNRALWGEVARRFGGQAR